MPGPVRCDHAIALGLNVRFFQDRQGLEILQAANVAGDKTRFLKTLMIERAVLVSVIEDCPEAAELEGPDLVERPELTAFQFAQIAQLGRFAAAPQGYGKENVAHQSLIKRHR